MNKNQNGRRNGDFISSKLGKKIIEMPFHTILNPLNINICITTLFYRKSMLHFRIQYIYIGIRHVCSSVCVSI